MPAAALRIRTSAARRRSWGRDLAALSLAALVLLTRGCPGRGELPAAAAQVVHLDERAVLVVRVRERLAAGPYLYLRVTILRDSARPASAAPGERWLALERSAGAAGTAPLRSATPRVGAVIRVRSLARRTRVWQAELGREFDRLEYVAPLAPLVPLGRLDPLVPLEDGPP